MEPYALSSLPPLSSCQTPTHTPVESSCAITKERPAARKNGLVNARRTSRKPWETCSFNEESAAPADAVRAGATGIDTIKLFFPLRLSRRPDFHILARSQARGRDHGEGFLWRDPQGHLAYGSIAVRRAGVFRFRIAPVGGEIKLRVFFSAPAVVHGHNARAVTQNELHTALETMQNALSELGVCVDWREGQVSRVDVHRDVALIRPFHFYRNVLHLIEPRYGRLYQNYPTGVVRGAATRLVYNLYDKAAQCRARGTVLPCELDDLSGWLRCEARLPTAAAVRHSLGLDSAEELVERFEELAPWLDERIEKDLLGEEIPEHFTYPDDPYRVAPTLTSADDDWWKMQLMGEAEGFKDRLALLGLRFACESLGPQRFWELARSASFDGGLQPSKWKGHFRQMALKSFSDEQLPMAQLYGELKDALLNTT